MSYRSRSLDIKSTNMHLLRQKVIYLTKIYFFRLASTLVKRRTNKDDIERYVLSCCALMLLFVLQKQFTGTGLEVTNFCRHLLT